MWREECIQHAGDQVKKTLKDPKVQYTKSEFILSKIQFWR